jgi:uncharacterized membrane protein
MVSSLSGRKRYRTNKQDLDWAEERADKNVSREEALFSGLAGTVLLLAGISRRSLAGATLAVTGAALLHRGITQHCPIYEMLGANTNELGRRKVPTRRALKIQKRITIDRPAAELYRFWRNFANLPRIMRHLESVEVINDRLSHWAVKPLPGIPTIEWDAEVVNEVENQRIGWRSLAGADVETAGSVQFRPDSSGAGTQLTVILQYDLPGGQIGRAIARLLGQDPESLTNRRAAGPVDLRQLALGDPLTGREPAGGDVPAQQVDKLAGPRSGAGPRTLMLHTTPR